MPSLARTSIAATAVLLWVGCSDPPDGNDTGPDTSTDTSVVDTTVVDTRVDAEIGADDTSVDVATDTDAETDARTIPDELSVTSGDTTLVVETDPFDLHIRGPSGDERTQLADADEPAFEAISVARAISWRDNKYYDPRLQEDGTGQGLRWFSSSEVVDVSESSSDPDKVALRVATTDADGNSGPTLDVTARAIPDAPGLGIDVTGPDKDRFVHTAINWQAADGEGYYGLGEHYDEVDLRGSIRAMQIQTEDNSESGMNEVHVPIPFYLSTRDYGLFVDDRHPAAFDLGATDEDVVRATWNARDITYRLFVDDGPMSLVEKYTDVTGKPADVPYWALAPMWWRNETDGQSEVLDDANRGREADVPSTVLWIDRPWSSYYHNWRFIPERYPNPQAMFDELHKLGYRVLLHHSPHMNVPGTADIGDQEDDSEMLYQKYKDNGWLVEQDNGEPFIFPWSGGRGAFVDFTERAAVDHVQKLIERVTKFGVIGTKMDWDEFFAPNIASTKLIVHFDNGETNQTMHDWYTAVYHKAIIEAFDEDLGEQSFHISRSGAPGDQKWNTCIWPGDLDSDMSPHTRGPSEIQDQWNVGGLPSAIMANQTLGFSGYPCFGSDIGGFRDGRPGAETLMRWVAFGTFNTVMQLGGGGGTHMAWTHDSPYKPKVLEVTRKYFKLRMQLFPYIHHYLREASETGRPVSRSMYLAFPDDEEARTHEDQFMFGPDLLVAPVHDRGARKREVYLPPGKWIDYWTGEIHDGGQTIERDAPLDIIPLYLRRGAQIPLAPEGIDTLVPAAADDVTSYADKKAIRLHVAPGKQETSRSYFNGLEATTAADDGGADIDVTLGEPADDIHPDIAFSPTRVTLEIELAGTDVADGPSSVTFDDGNGSETLSEDTNCTNCWSFETDRNLLTVRLDGDGRVEIR